MYYMVIVFQLNNTQHIINICIRAQRTEQYKWEPMACQSNNIRVQNTVCQPISITLFLLPHLSLALAFSLCLSLFYYFQDVPNAVATVACCNCWLLLLLIGFARLS